MQGLCRVQSASSSLPSSLPLSLQAAPSLLRSETSDCPTIGIFRSWRPPPGLLPQRSSRQRHPSIKRLIDPAGFRRGRSELFSPREAQQLWTVMIKGARAARPSPRPPAALLPSAAGPPPARPLLNYLRVSRGEPSCINSVRSPCLLEVAVYIAVAPLPGAGERVREGRKGGGPCRGGDLFGWSTSNICPDKRSSDVGKTALDSSIDCDREECTLHSTEIADDPLELLPSRSLRVNEFMRREGGKSPSKKSVPPHVSEMRCRARKSSPRRFVARRRCDSVGLALHRSSISANSS